MMPNIPTKYLKIRRGSKSGMNFIAMGIGNRRTCNGKKNKESHQMPTNLYEHIHETIVIKWGVVVIHHFIHYKLRNIFLQTIGTNFY
mgnify:CR=1 FL=1